MADQPRLKRLCDVCAGLDDHPRHVQSLPDGSEGTVPSVEFLTNLPDGIPALAIAELMDPTTVVRHMDCCANTGCQICRDVLKTTKNAHGPQLLSAIQKGAVDKLGTPPGREVFATAPDDAQEA